MIATIRKKFGKQAFNFVTWITLLSLAGGIFVTGLFRRFSGVPTSAVADVNGYEIPARELQRKIYQEERYISQIRQQFGKNAQIILDAYGLSGKTEDRALQLLVNQKLLLSAADKVGIVPSPEYISTKMHDVNFARQMLGDMLPPNFVTATGVNYRELLKVLQRQGISAECVEQAIDDGVKQQLILSLASGASYVPDMAVRETFDRVYRAHKYLIVKIPLAPYIKKEQGEKVAEDTLKKFYEENKDRSRCYKTPEKRGGKLWTFENVPTSFAEEGKRVIGQAGSAFDEFVKKYKGVVKDVPATERKTGNEASSHLFETARGSRSVWTEVIDKKKQPEQVRGYVVEVTSIDPEVLLDYAAAKDKVAEDYAREQAIRKLANDIEELKAFGPSKRSSWVQEHKGSEKTTDFISFDKAEDAKDLQKEGVPVHAFSELTEKGDRIAVPTANDGYMIELVEDAPYDEKLFNEKRANLIRGLAHEDIKRVLQSFIAFGEKNAKIKTNKSLFKPR